MSDFNAAQSVFLHEDNRGILQAVLNQSLADVTGDLRIGD
jgi:hypothetical protein